VPKKSTRRRRSIDYDVLLLSKPCGCRLVRIVEEELIAVRVIDHQEPVAPRPSFTKTPWLKVGAQSIQRSHHSFPRLGSTFREMNVSALPILSGHVSASMSAQPWRSTCATRGFSAIFVAPRTREAEPVNIKAE
jgi:hypothetical protein